MTLRTPWARLFGRAGRVRYAVATGGDASWRLEARRRRSPARPNKRRVHPPARSIVIDHQTNLENQPPKTLKNLPQGRVHLIRPEGGQFEVTGDIWLEDG